MATTTTINSNYAGKTYENPGLIIGQSFKEADTLRLNLLTVAENVNYKLNLRKIQLTSGTVDYTCGFTPEGAIDLSNKVLEPLKFKTPLQVCKEDFRQTWSEDLEGASAHNDNMPNDIESAIVNEVLAEHAEKIDNQIWNGDSANAGEFDGLVKQFTADANVIKPAGTGNPVQEITILADIKTALAAIPVSLRRKDLVVAVSPDVFQLYNFKQVDAGVNNGLGGEDKQARFGRYTLTEVNGLADNTICIFERKNMVFATGLLGDHNELKVVDEDEIGLLTGQVRMSMVYNCAVGYYNSEEIVYYVSTEV
jgi:hypothetical protein